MTRSVSYYQGPLGLFSFKIYNTNIMLCGDNMLNGEIFYFAFCLKPQIYSRTEEMEIFKVFIDVRVAYC